jgi:hypothetical protein
MINSPKEIQENLIALHSFWKHTRCLTTVQQYVNIQVFHTIVSAYFIQGCGYHGTDESDAVWKAYMQPQQRLRTQHMWNKASEPDEPQKLHFGG